MIGGGHAARSVVAALALVASATACGDDGSRTLEVYAARSLTEAFAELEARFEADHPDVDVVLNLDASSALARQIVESQAADVFASADRQNMQLVLDAGIVDEGPDVFARNVLTIAVPRGNPAGVDSIEDLADGDLLLGLCAPEVPCGRFGRELLERSAVEATADTEEPDVRSLLTKIEAGELDAGLVYLTDVLAAGDAVERIDVPGAEELVAEYVIATTVDAGGDARAFVALVLSDVGRGVLAARGFRT